MAKALNQHPKIRKAYATSRRYKTQLKNNVPNVNSRTGEITPMTDKQKAYRMGYIKGVTTLGNGVLESAGVPEGKPLPDNHIIKHEQFKIFK